MRYADESRTIIDAGDGSFWPIDLFVERGGDLEAIEPWREHATVDDERAAAHNRLSRRRDTAIESFSFGGAHIRLTSETRAKITGAVLGVTIGVTEPVHWQVSASQFIDLGPEQILALGRAAHAHIEACFTNTRALASLIEGSPGPLSVDVEIGWPQG